MITVIILIVLTTIYLKLEPRFTKVNGEWGVWYNTGRYEKREFKFLKDLL